MSAEGTLKPPSPPQPPPRALEGSLQRPYLYKTDQAADEGINRNGDGEDVMQDSGYQVMVQEKGHFSDNCAQKGCLYQRKGGKKSIFIHCRLSEQKLMSLRHFFFKLLSLMIRQRVRHW